MKKSVLLFVVLGLTAVFLFCGCDNFSESDVESNESEQASGAILAGFRNTVLYYTDETGFLVPLMRRIPWEEGIGKAALTYLKNTPENCSALDKLGLNAPIPSNSEFSLSIKDGVATVNFNEKPEFDNVDEGKIMLQAITKTLLEFPTIDSVKFKVNGKDNAFELEVEDVMNTNINMINMEDAEVSVMADGKLPFILYFPNENASLYIPVTRYSDSGVTFASALQELIKGPESSGLLACFSPNTMVINAHILNGIATVNLSEDFMKDDYTEGLEDAIYKTLFLTANAIEPIYKLEIYAGGELCDFCNGKEAVLYPNEY